MHQQGIINDDQQVMLGSAVIDLTSGGHNGDKLDRVGAKVLPEEDVVIPDGEV